jgi:isocitrate dehydrogenase
LGEFLALAVSIEDLAIKTKNNKALVVAKALDQANSQFLESNKSPSRKVGELDNRGSHFYLALYWAQAMAAQNDDAELKALFGPLADRLLAAETEIVGELNAVQGPAVEIGGYYHPDPQRVSAAMRPSRTLNAALES